MERRLPFLVMNRDVWSRAKPPLADPWYTSLVAADPSASRLEEKIEDFENIARLLSNEESIEKPHERITKEPKREKYVAAAGVRRGRPPGTNAPTRRSKGMSAAQKKAVSKRMKAYWAKRRAEK